MCPSVQHIGKQKRCDSQCFFSVSFSLYHLLFCVFFSTRIFVHVLRSLGTFSYFSFWLVFLVRCFPVLFFCSLSSTHVFYYAYFLFIVVVFLLLVKQKHTHTHTHTNFFVPLSVLRCLRLDRIWCCPFLVHHNCIKCTQTHINSQFTYIHAYSCSMSIS